MLTILRVLNLVVWGVLLIYMLPAARSAIIQKDVRRADPWRLGVAAVSVFIILGNLRWLIAPDNEGLFIAIYVLGLLVGGFKVVLARVYGRGPRL